jgi:hypothetical protein
MTKNKINDITPNEWDSLEAQARQVDLPSLSQPIRTKADYRAALRDIESLMDDAELDSTEGERLDVLATLVEAYEAKHDYSLCLSAGDWLAEKTLNAEYDFMSDMTTTLPTEPAPPVTLTTIEDSPPRTDNVNAPFHYNAGKIECIEGIEASMSSEAFKGYLKGNCQKYLWRFDYKGKAKEDLQKASWYLNKLITVVIIEGKK